MKNTLDVLKVSAGCLNNLYDRGLDVAMSTDFQASEARALAMGKPGVAPKMSVKFNDFTAENAFWLFVTDGQKDIACVSARLDPVGREGMGHYLMRTTDRHHPNPSGPSIAKITDAIPADFHGRMVYIGELFIREGERGSMDMLRNLMLLMQCSVATRWEMDWVYAFMRDRDVRRGFATQYGFTVQLPGAQEWRDPPPKGRDSSEWLVALKASHLEHMMRHYARSLQSL